MTAENVAVLFTDMVGSTALASSLSPQAADELRREHFSILRQAVAEAEGAEVKNLGDGLMVVFASASAALSCAVAMQQGIERDNRSREQVVGLRVGLSGGEVSREDDDYFGDPVVEAARLCAKCESGQVLAADIVRLTAGRRSLHECRPIGELDLKGLPDPVATVEVAWEPLGGSAAEGIPLPARLGARPLSGVVGRATEIASMFDAYKRVAAGEGREVVLVSGEAGLGKTTLVADVARAAFDAGACVLFGHCEEDLATPYQFFREALGHYVTHAPADHLHAHVSEHGSELARLVPALASRIPDLPPSRATDADTERFLLFSAVVGLLSAASAQDPFVVALDDLQWADPASLLLLRHVIASELPMRVLVLGTHRGSELSRSQPFLETLAALRRQPGVARIELAGLDEAAVVALMEATAGHLLEGGAVELAQALHRETDGNPFFLSEVLIHLAETGAIFQDADGRWVAVTSLAELSLPDSVREVIGARVGRLGRDAERALAVAAVIGRDFDFDVLAGATKSDEDDLLDVLDAAAGAGLVRELSGASGRYSFAHSLIQHTLYEDLGPTRRARAHRRIADALEKLCGEEPGARVGDLARHWCNATEPIDVDKAIDYSRRAGDAALAALAPSDAVRYYRQALDLYPHTAEPDPVVELDLSIGLGTAQRQVGDPVSRETLLHAARQAAELNDTDRLVAAALANDRGLASSIEGIDAEKVEILETALGRLPIDDPDRAFVLATLCQELTWGSPLERRQALADEALAIAESSGDDATIVRVSNHLGDPLHIPPLLAQSLARTADALTRAQRLGDPVLLFFAAGYRAMIAPCSGDVDEMDRCLEIEATVVDQLDQPTLTWVHTFTRTVRALIAGDVDRADQLAADALRIGTESGQPDATTFHLLQSMEVSWQRGAMGDAVPLLERAVADYPGLPVLRAGLAVAYAEAGRIDATRRLLQEFAARQFDLPREVGNWLPGMALYAEAAIESADSTAAQALLDRLAPYVDLLSCDDVTAEGPVAHFLGGLAGVLGRYEAADEYFTRAAALSARVDAKFFAARTGLAWARLLIARGASGDAVKARVLLTNALGTATAHGYATVERHAAAALQQLD